MSAMIAAEVRAEVARQNLTQQQLADRLGVNQWWVSRRLIEPVRDRKPPTSISAAELVLIAEALDVAVAQFLRPVAAVAVAA